MIEVAPKSEEIMTYAEAVLYCRFLDYNGRNDWRLPTSEEYKNNEKIINFAWYDGLDAHQSWKHNSRFAMPVRAIT